MIVGMPHAEAERSGPEVAHRGYSAVFDRRWVPGAELGVTQHRNGITPGEGPVNDAKLSSVRVEIYDQAYNLRGSDPEYIFKLAGYVDSKMRAVARQTSTVDSLRLAVLAALNIADEYHLLKRKYEAIASEVNQRAHHLSGALDEVLQDGRRLG
jgi:cell division protein ZapA